MYAYKVASKQKDANNGNINITVQFENDANPGVILTRTTFAFDLNDTTIDAWARKVIETLEARDENFDAITLNVQKSPDPIDQKKQDVIDAKIVLEKAIQTAELKQKITTLNDNDVNAAYQNLISTENT